MHDLQIVIEQIQAIPGTADQRLVIKTGEREGMGGLSRKCNLGQNRAIPIRPIQHRRTGDSAALGLWLTMLTLSAAAGAILVLRRKREQA